MAAGSGGAGQAFFKLYNGSAQGRTTLAVGPLFLPRKIRRVATFCRFRTDLARQKVTIAVD
jgi:hypothetical protein